VYREIPTSKTSVLTMFMESSPPPGWDPGTVDRVLAAFSPGRVSEIVGPRSSGATSLLTALIAKVSRGGGHVALVDAADALDVESAASAGVDLSRVLWVRCGGRLAAAARAADLLARCPGFGLVAVDLGDRPAAAGDPVSRALGLRLERAVQRSSTALVIRSPQRVAGSAAALVVTLRRAGSRWMSGPCPTRLGGLASEMRIVRSRGAIACDGATVQWRA
jgi:recA bacterial DNA recombination protein